MPLGKTQVQPKWRLGWSLDPLPVSRIIGIDRASQDSMASSSGPRTGSGYGLGLTARRIKRSCSKPTHAVPTTAAVAARQHKHLD